MTEDLPAPAGDGGLWEALEKVLSDHKVGRHHPASPFGVAGYRAVIVDALLAAYPAAPAVPQPVDREAGEKA